MRRKLQTLPGNVNSKLGHPRVGGGGQIRRGPERDDGRGGRGWCCLWDGVFGL